VLRGERAQRRATLAVLAIGAVTLLLAFTWSRVSSPAWAERYLMVVAAPFVVLAGAGLGRVRLLGVAAVVLAVVLSWHGRPSHEALAHKSNVGEVAQALAPLLPPGSLVVTTQPEQVPALRYYLGERLRYVTPLGAVRDPRVMDWRDALARLRAARFGAVMTPLLRGMRAGARLLFVEPRFAAGRTPWSRRIMADTTVWRRALRERLHLVAMVEPARSNSQSTVAGMVLSVPRPRARA
jgi:hypothetical protein